MCVFPIQDEKGEDHACKLETVCRGYFCKIWCKGKTVRHITVRKWMRFRWITCTCMPCHFCWYNGLHFSSKCDVCVKTRAKLPPWTVNIQQEEEDRKKLYKEHLLWVKLERTSYWSRRQRGIWRPGSFLSIIIDGADQTQNGCPRWHEKTYALQGAWRMPVRFI